MLYITIPTHQRLDYFTIRPPADDHFSTETPLISPVYSIADDTVTATAISTNPLLACRDIASTPSSPTTHIAPTPQTFLQMQTNASHGEPAIRRPKPSPIQNVLHTTSDESDKSADSSTSGSSRCHRGSSSIELARCSRCHRTPSIDVKTGQNNMVSYGLNLWYCNRCAQMVGMVNR